MANFKTSTQTWIERPKGGERTLLVYVELYPYPTTDYLPEFKALALSADLMVVEVIRSKRQKPEPKYFVGQGKAEEIQQAVSLHKMDLLIVNHELTPAQARNLEKLCECKVMDRSELILDIFAKRARTFEGQLQIELAQLRHASTRLVRGWTHLERQKGGIGMRGGMGETQLEIDRRLIHDRIEYIEERLEKVLKQREQGRRSRQRAQIPTVSLVGYTNAGKSTLFNALTKAHVYVADQLFATLDPTLRGMELPGFGRFILADTVGFIRDLPHDLVAAFRATLEESQQADVLLHVIDCSDPKYLETVHSVNKVLKEIHADQVPQLKVYNKIDLLGESAHIDYDEAGQPTAVWLSALHPESFSLLFQAISSLLSENLVRYEVVLGHHQGALRAKLYALQAVKEEHLNEAHEWCLTIELSESIYEQLFQKKD